ncbi:hypothetical protein CDAR_221301 [Caerostris darwini]|uniref:Uncharacterized protein n=1 Tax=Caerostris darwini TaxID=1538125 RepID=A0AAV4WKP8_9ARAC|nr:hypothetical protein CDAR_221301 [Caerostris darwini]
MALNLTTLAQDFVSVNTSMVYSTLDGLDNTTEAITILLILISSFGLTFYFCCRELQLVPRLRRMIRKRRRGRRNLRVHFELPFPTRRDVAASQCPSDQLPQEDRRVSRDETPPTRMEAKENIPMPKIPMETDL